MRSVLHLGAVTSLLLSFAQAPFRHAHARDPHHEHARGFAHTHWKSTIPDGPVWSGDDPDSDARILDWLAGDGRAPAKFLVALPESVADVVLAVRVIRIPELTPRNHDPPWRLSLHPRGPPA